VIIGSLLALGLAQAAPQAEIGDASIALTRCTLPQVQEAASGTESAEAIADAALAACPEPLAQIRSIFVRISGEADAGARMQMVIAEIRPRLIRVVNERRGLVSRQETDATAWGDCIRARATALATRPDPAEPLGDEAMRQCAENEAAVRAGLVRRRGAVAADQLMPAITAETRRLAVQAVQQARARDSNSD
jgi:hypothetical protein